MRSSPPITRLSPSEDVLQRLTALIDEGEFPPGTSLPPERQLAESLGASRVVIREAARKLEQRGLVSIRHGIGVLVTNNPGLPVQQMLERILPNEKDRLQQCAQARLLVEPELAAAAAIRTTPAQVKKLGTLCEALLGAPDVGQAAELDVAFHARIAELAGNKVLAVMLASVSELGRRSREVTLEKYGVARAHGYHTRILAALAAGDPGAARRAMAAHLKAALGDLA